MRTTLDIPEDLVTEAMQATQIRTKTKVIITALEELIRKKKISQIKEFKGKFSKMEIDLDTLRARAKITSHFRRRFIPTDGVAKTTE